MGVALLVSYLTPRALPSTGTTCSLIKSWSFVQWAKAGVCLGVGVAIACLESFQCLAPFADVPLTPT